MSGDRYKIADQQQTYFLQVKGFTKALFKRPRYALLNEDGGGVSLGM